MTGSVGGFKWRGGGRGVSNLPAYDLYDLLYELKTKESKTAGSDTNGLSVYQEKNRPLSIIKYPYGKFN